MSNKNDNKQALQDANARRIDEIVTIAEKHARTERHLEKDLEITSHEAKENERRIQEERENEIENLKNIVAYGQHDEID
ncbi:MAG: hypothetical protein Q8936_12115 [Bacillota bacterium]|nr:hypothetical protein [Bacillota bacterium]